MYKLISTKEVLKDLCPKKGKTTEEIRSEIEEIRNTSNKILRASKNPNPSPIDVIIIKDAIRVTRINLENCLKELNSRN
jgi:hypothetical protein